MSAGRRREASQGEGIEGDSDSTLLASSSITASFRLWIYPIRTYKPHLCAKPAFLCRNPKQSSLNRSRPPKTRNMKATNTTANSPQLRSECGGIWNMPVAALHYTNVSHIQAIDLRSEKFKFKSLVWGSRSLYGMINNPQIFTWQAPLWGSTSSSPRKEIGIPTPGWEWEWGGMGHLTDVVQGWGFI